MALNLVPPPTPCYPSFSSEQKANNYYIPGFIISIIVVALAYGIASAVVALDDKLRKKNDQNN